MKGFKLKNITVICVMFLSMLFVQNSIIKANTTVNNTNELKTAIANKENVILGGSFTVSERIAFPADYKGTISGNGNTLTLGASFEMFSADASTINVTFENVNFDAASNGRILNIRGGANITVNQGSFKNGRSWVEGKSQSYDYSDGGAIYIANSKFTANGTTFQNNMGVTPNPKPRDGMNGHGGAIYAYTSNINLNSIVGIGNVSGFESGGGFAFIDGKSVVNVNDSMFAENHTNATSIASNQGGVFYLADSTITSHGNTYNISKTFNTGGGLYIYKSTANISQDKYFATNLGDGFGISGAAVLTYDSDTTIDWTNFNITGGKVIHAGGLVDVVGGGNLKITRSNFDGEGSSWNGPVAATYGGAIAFESGATTVAFFEHVNINNIASEKSGAIAVSTKYNEESSVNLTLKNVNIYNTRSNHAWDPTAVGGAIFIGPGNTVKIDSGSIMNSFATRGGAIYNQGTLDITTDSEFLTNITGNTSYEIGGAIYNDGKLRVDKAILTNNRNAEGKTYLNKTNPIELIGGNIYANKDVTITPNAMFDENDVRILDKQSIIILTGALTNKINVSISEKPIGTASDIYYEAPKRYLGYTVAKGDKYQPTVEDAKKLHYVTLDYTQETSSPNDHTSIGKWDYLLNPETHTIVLGQRAMVTYDVNAADASFNDGSTTKDQPLDVYKPNISVISFTDVPTRSGYNFVGWFEEVDKDNVRNIPGDGVVPTDKFRTNFNYANEITTILNPYHIKAYAGWQKIEPKYEVMHIFESATSMELPDAIKQFTPENQTGKTNGTVVTPTNTFVKMYLDAAYDGIWTFSPGWTKNSEVVQNANVTFIGKWTFTPEKYIVEHEFKKADGVSIELPESIKQRTPDDQTDKVNGMDVSPTDTFEKTYVDATNDGTWTFVSWDKTSKTITRANVKFVGTWAFTPNKYIVEHHFKAEDGTKLELPKEISDLTPTRISDLLDKTVVTPSSFAKMSLVDTKNNGTWVFVGWDKSSVTINRKNEKFVGVWKFVKTTTKAPVDTSDNNLSITYALFFVISLSGLLTLKRKEN